ncbi:MAG: flagellar biosynthesis protein FlhB [Rickettsiales bacterium]|nr:flagellar biosynthesis protein FlhB [Rickettsiales bacterium]|tara:strand:+ start:1788 stop:2873 length:1086 start_codon:yes stop_codon:yes gene_type:complete
MSDSDQEDDSQKTEDPTPKRLKEMREKGQVVMSRELNSWVLLLAGTFVLLLIGPWMMSGIAHTIKTFIAMPHRLAADPYGLMEVLRHALTDIGLYLFLPALLLVVAAIAAPFVQVGPIFSAETIKPKLEKISPLSGFKRLFGAKAFFEFFKGLVKIILVSGVIAMIVWPYTKTLTADVGQNVLFLMARLEGLTMKVLIGVLVLVFVMAVIDYIYQRNEHMKKARMSRKEIRDEYKQTEGDPHVKGKLRQLRQQRARQRMMAAVPEADVVITNPTHFAVALKYEPGESTAPVCVAKGQDFVALKIREVANEHNIEIMENPPLARALYAGMEIDDEIPPEHYQAVAAIIRYVFKKKGKNLSKK